MDSVKQLQEEKANYLARRSGTSSALLSGSEIRAVIDQHVRHIERCMTARLESYRKAFTDPNQNPTENDFKRFSKKLRMLVSSKSRIRPLLSVISSDLREVRIFRRVYWKRPSSKSQMLQGMAMIACFASGRYGVIKRGLLSQQQSSRGMCKMVLLEAPGI